MEPKFWRQRWEQNSIAFHNNETNPLLVKYLDQLSLQKDDRIFLPLCGKTVDIPWLVSKGYGVIGSELSETAVDQLFDEMNIAPEISRIEGALHYKSRNIDIFAGDIFNLSRDVLGQIDAIYDRAALVALPTQMRKQYAAHLIEITQTAPQLLICYEYDQNRMAGPPFSVNEQEVKEHYQSDYKLNLLTQLDVTGGLKGCPAQEKVWLLEKI